MDRIIKAVIFGGKARVAIIDTTEMVNKSINMHNLSPLSAAALGRTLTVGSYILSNLKNNDDKFNIIIDGGGPLGKIYAAGGCGEIKGFLENPSLELPYKNGKLDVGGAVGCKGDFIVIKDMGLKEPYVGKVPLVSGEIGEDFAEYLLKSEGITSAVAVGVLNDKDGCKASGGIIIEALPSADENILFILEDILTNFENFSSVLAIKSVEDIAEFYFGHLDSKIFPSERIVLKCNCSEKIESIVVNLGKGEAEEIIKEQGVLELHCDYCSKYYRFSLSDIENIIGRYYGENT
jgi:molecular chaperone Hsp33